MHFFDTLKTNNINQIDFYSPFAQFYLAILVYILFYVYLIFVHFYFTTIAILRIYNIFF